MDSSLDKLTNHIKNGVNSLSNTVKSSASKMSNFMSHSVKSIRDSSVDTIEKSGVSEMINKVKSLSLFDEMDIKNIIIILIAVIVIITVVFFLPKLNKSATFEKKLFNSKFFKFIICLFLFYAFYNYDLPLFCMCLVIIFLFMWFHNGCFTEHMIGEEITKELNKTPAIIVRIEGGEIVVEDAEKFKQMIISDKIDEIKSASEETLGDKIKSTASSAVSTASDAVSSVASTASDAVSAVASTASSALSTVASPITNLFSKDDVEEIQPKEIFDQRDFMVLNETAPQQQEIYNHICDGTRCMKPTSFVDNMDSF